MEIITVIKNVTIQSDIMIDTDKEINFGELIKIIFPSGDRFCLRTEDIAEICSRYFYIQFHELLSPDAKEFHSIDVANSYKKREKEAIKFIKENEV